jgi:hypothetical protein
MEVGFGRELRSREAIGLLFPERAAMTSSDGFMAAGVLGAVFRSDILSRRPDSVGRESGGSH